jgi:hypothetical protein
VTHQSLEIKIQKHKLSSAATSSTIRNRPEIRKPAINPRSTAAPSDGKRNPLPFAKKSPGVMKPHATDANVKVQKASPAELSTRKLVSCVRMKWPNELSDDGQEARRLQP